MTAQIQSDYISDVAEAAGLEEDQVTVTSIEETATNTYTIKSTIHFYEFDAAAAQALVTKLQNKTAFTRLSQSSANITSVHIAVVKVILKQVLHNIR